MTDFNVDIKVDSSSGVNAAGRVTAALDGVERKGKQTGDSLSRSVSGGLGSALDTVNSKVRELTGFIGDLGLAGNTVMGLARAFMSAASAVTSWHVNMLAMNDALIETTNRLRNVTEGTTQLNFAMANTRGIADRSLTSWDTTVDVYARMANATRELGLSQQHVGRLTETLSKMFQASGRSAGETSAAMLQLSQAIGSGVLQGDEFRSLAENAPQLLNVFARELGVTRGELKKLASEGKITTDVMISGLDKMAESADRAFDRMEKTFAQKVRPLLNELKGDPNKINRAVSMQSLQGAGDAADIAGGMFNAGLLDGDLASSFLGGAQRVQMGVGAAAELGRAWEDLGNKMRDLGAEMDGTSRRDPWATPKQETLAWDQHLQRLIENVEKLTGPKIVADGAKAWAAFGGMIGTFANNAMNDLDGVLGRVADLAGTGSTSVIKQAIDRFVEQAKKNASWDNTRRDRPTGGRRTATRTDPWSDTFVSQTLVALDQAIAEAKDVLDRMNAQQSLAGIGGDANNAIARDGTIGATFKKYSQRRDYTAEWEFRMRTMTDRWKEFREAGTQAIGHVEDAFARLFTTGEFGAEKMFSAILADLTRMATHRLLMMLLGAATGGGGTASIFGTGATQAFSGLYGGGRATGGIYRAPMTGGGVDSIPVLFRMSPGEVARFDGGGQGGAQTADGGVRERTIYVDRRSLTAKQDKEEIIRVALEAGFVRRR